MHGETLAPAWRHDAVEAAAYRDMFAAAPRDLAQALGLQTREIAGATLLIAPGLPATIFNRVIGLGNGALATDADLEAIAGAYASAGVRNWWIHATPGEHFDALCALLAAHGFVVPARRSWAKTWRGTAAPPDVQTAAQIRPARDPDGAQVAEVLGTAFGMPASGAPWFVELVRRPGWLTTAAVMGGKVIGAGMLHLQGDAAWMGVGGVLPDARRAHAHRALMAQRIREAIGRGCTGIYTETGEPAGDEPNPSLRNMQACGFRKVCSRLNYAAPAA